MARVQAANAVPHVVVDYAPDPFGAAMFADVLGAATRPLQATGHVPVTGRVWHGDTAAPQTFHGMANLGAARPHTGRSSTVHEQRAAGGLNDTPAWRAFSGLDPSGSGAL